MTNNVLCDEFAERLADLLERDVDEATRATLESHALACDECGSLLADLRKLRIDASNLPLLAPSRDLWQGIADRIDAPVIPIHTAGTGATRRSHRWERWAGLAAAAVVLVAVTSTTTYYLKRDDQSAAVLRNVAAAPKPADSTPSGAPDRSPAVVATTQPSENRSARPDAESAAAERPQPTTSPSVRFAGTKPSAEQVYAGEIARLRTIVQQRRSQLDPVTISVIERNLRVIDDAIAQCKLALAKDPASRFLMESLNDALETKVELLRTAAMLPARS